MNLYLFFQNLLSDLDEILYKGSVCNAVGHL
jgi:hypothetical protein